MNIKTFNPELPFIKPGWTGNPLTNRGRFTNIYGDDLKDLRDVFRWLTGPRPLTKLKKRQHSPLSYQPIQNLGDKSRNAIIPLGHASFIVDINGIRLLIDPVLKSHIFLKRYTKIPFRTPDLTNVDYLLLSHNHRDHLDKDSVLQICRNNPKLTILTGLNIGKLLISWGIKNEIQEAGWYQRFKTSHELQIDFLPSHHWSRRWLTDTNKTLWGSFIIQDQAHHENIYFASDSAYQPHFAEIGSNYSVDIAMIGIGAYEPRWFMSSAHTSPAEGLQAFKDLAARKWIPMHYGTFDLSDEPIFYPEKILKEQFPNDLNSVIWMQIGKRVYF